MLIGALDFGGTKTIASAAIYKEGCAFPACLDIIGRVTFATGAPGRSFRDAAAECARIIAGILRDRKRLRLRSKLWA
jgi:hypothetical protein